MGIHHRSLTNVVWSLFGALALFLLLAIVASPAKASVATEGNAPAVAQTQLAWWHGGYWRGGGGGWYGRHWYGGCPRVCWRGAWGYVHCARRC